MRLSHATRVSTKRSKKKTFKGLNCLNFSIIKSLTPYQSVSYYFVNEEDALVSLVIGHRKSLRPAPSVSKHLGTQSCKIK